MKEDLAKAKEIVLKHEQEHLLSNYDKLPQEKREKLLEQILSINFEEVDFLFKNIKNQKKNITQKVEPIEYIDKQKLTSEELEKYNDIGKNWTYYSSYTTNTSVFYVTSDYYWGNRTTFKTSYYFGYSTNTNYNTYTDNKSTLNYSTLSVSYRSYGNSSYYTFSIARHCNLQAKSLKVYMEKYHPNYAIRTSLSDYNQNENLLRNSLKLI